MTHPATGEVVECRIDGLTHAELEALPLDEQVCADIARDIAPCLPEEFLAAYVLRVGVARAGISVLGAWLESRARDWMAVNVAPLVARTPPLATD